MTASENTSAAQEIDAIISKYDDWRGQKLHQIRTLIKEANPEIIEEVKWKKPTNPDGIPVWSHNGIVCMGETYKAHLRITFAKGKSLNDPKGLINSFRAMILHEEDSFDEAAFKKLIQEAVALNNKTKNQK